MFNDSNGSDLSKKYSDMVFIVREITYIQRILKARQCVKSDCISQASIDGFMVKYMHIMPIPTRNLWIINNKTLDNRLQPFVDMVCLCSKDFCKVADETYCGLEKNRLIDMIGDQRDKVVNRVSWW